MCITIKGFIRNGWLPLALSFLIAQDGPGIALAQTAPSRLDIIVVAGEGVTTPIDQRVAQDPAVRIEDEDHRPIAGVPVVFALPVSGTSGQFVNGSKTVAVMTDEQGLAVARGLKTNDAPGKLQIYVTVSFRGLRARALINQIVEAVPGAPRRVQRTTKSGSGNWKWALLGVVAAGGAGAAVYFGRNTSTTVPPAPISIGAGTVVFGSPR